MRLFRGLFWVLLLAFIVILVLRVPKQLSRVEEYNYSEFLQRVEKGDVAEAKIEKNTIKGKLRDGKTHFVTYGYFDADKLNNFLKKHGVQFGYRRPVLAEFWGSIFSMFIFLAIIILVWFWIMRQLQAGSSQAMSFGRSKVKRFMDTQPRATFNDVAGVDEAKQELMEVIEFLKNQKKFEVLGAKIPKGVLLLGPPGCGKTLLARAVAGEAGVPFFHISGSDFVEMFVGVGAARVRDLFETAKVSRPCIIFIDELDAVGRQRGAGLGGGHDEREQTLNQLLVEMDGFDPNIGVILLAATNRPDILDPALLRPGRFDRRIVVDNPDVKGREKILGVHTRGKPLGEDVDLDVLARKTPGFSGADLANLVNEAALLAARREKQKIGMEELEESIERVVAGPQRKSRVISDKEKEVVAYHELGHALLGNLLPHCDPVTKVTILPRGLALGYTMQLPLEDRYLMTKSELLDRITMMLGGRAVEEIVFNEVTTGAQNDLEQATEIARKMITEFGMSDKLGPLTLGRRHGPIFLGRDLLEERNYSEEVASAVDREVKNIVDECYAKAHNILAEKREALDRVAKVLLEKETLEGEELQKLMEDVKKESEVQN